MNKLAILYDLCSIVFVFIKILSMQEPPTSSAEGLVIPEKQGIYLLPRQLLNKSMTRTTRSH